MKYFFLFLTLAIVFSCVAVGHSAYASTAYVQSALATTTSASSLSASFASTPAPGDLVIVAVNTQNSNANVQFHQVVSSITDNQGNSYALAAMNVTENSDLNYVYYAKNISSSGTFTVTANLYGNGNSISMVIEEVSGADALHPFDQSVGNSTYNLCNQVISSGNASTSYNGEFFFALEDYNINGSPTSPPTVTVGSPFTMRQSYNTVSTVPIQVADMVSNPTMTSSTFNYSESPNPYCVTAVSSLVVIFKAGGSKSGYLDSATFDTQLSSGGQLNSIGWQGTQPAGTTVGFQLSVNNSSSGPWTSSTFVGPDGTSNTYFQPNAGSASTLTTYGSFDNFRYFRYRITLFSDTSGITTPNVNDVMINWSP